MSADADLAAAIITRWNSTPISEVVPGGLQCDLVVGTQTGDPIEAASKTRPYAKLEVMQDSRAPEPSTSGERIEYHKATIFLWGIGRAAIGSVVSVIRRVFENPIDPWTVENTVAVMRVQPMGGMGAVIEEQSKDGNRLLKATIPYTFWLHRAVA